MTGLNLSVAERTAVTGGGGELHISAVQTNARPRVCLRRRVCARVCVCVWVCCALGGRRCTRLHTRIREPLTYRSRCAQFRLCRCEDRGRGSDGGGYERNAVVYK